MSRLTELEEMCGDSPLTAARKMMALESREADLEIEIARLRDADKEQVAQFNALARREAKLDKLMRDVLDYMESKIAPKWMPDFDDIHELDIVMAGVRQGGDRGLYFQVSDLREGKRLTEAMRDLIDDL